MKTFKGQLLCLSLMMMGVFALALSLGSVNLSLEDMLGAVRQVVSGEDLANQYQQIFFHVRLPRVFLAALVGVALSLAGLVMQSVLGNPLADGSTLGVSAGASLGAVLSLAFGWRLAYLPLSSTATVAAVFAVASLMGLLAGAYFLDQALSTQTLILLGIIFSMFASSMISLVILLVQTETKTILFWTMGSLSGANYRQVGILAVVLLIGGGLIFSCRRELNVLTLGEEGAHYLGVDVRRIRLKLLVAASILVGITVALCGGIAFVGLIVPHMMRYLTGADHRRLMPATCVAGATFLMVADLVARYTWRPVELPIGIVTSIVGAMVFCSILLRSRRQRSC